jgi:hypothetical protein
MMGGAAKITLRRCSTAAVYKSIRDSDHRLKTTAAAIIEALRYVPRLSYLHKKCEGEIIQSKFEIYIFPPLPQKKTQTKIELTNRIQKSYQKTSFSEQPYTHPTPPRLPFCSKRVKPQVRNNTHLSHIPGSRTQRASKGIICREEARQLLLREC